jgi:hypothetical protein
LLAEECSVRPDASVVQPRRRGCGVRVESGSLYISASRPPTHSAALVGIGLRRDHTPARRSRSAAEARGSQIEGRIPPVVVKQRERHANLPHNLGPHVQRVIGIFPLIERQCRPWVSRWLRQALLRRAHNPKVQRTERGRPRYEPEDYSGSMVWPLISKLPLTDGAPVPGWPPPTDTV